MMNYWGVTRPKRRLNSVPEVLGALAETALNQEWRTQRGSHLDFEEALERAGLKRIGERRDQTGGGGRTYQAWIASLGLIFTQSSTKQLKLTLAGEAIMDGSSPVMILKNQILKYQFPSAFSISRGVNVSPRFKIHPFWFLLKLLADPIIGFLSEEEIAKVVLVDAENESDRCYTLVRDKILLFREKGNSCLDKDFFAKYAPKTGWVNPEHPYSHLLDIANTCVNWLEYTQLTKREDKQLKILPEKRDEVLALINAKIPFIPRPEDEEFFQRRYGLDPLHQKDTRNLIDTRSVTPEMLAMQKIKQVFIAESLKRPIARIDTELVNNISEKTGFSANFVEEILLRLYPHGAIGAFMSEYFEMAFKGREDAVDFERATATLFKDLFGFETKHIGPLGLAPDVLLMSDSAGYVAIIDNKAYSKYSINNDHRNRMITNYIGNFRRYYDGSLPLAFFSYIAGGFGSNINQQIKDIAEETSVPGSAISVSNVIRMVENASAYTPVKIRDIFSLNRQVLLQDL